MEDKLLNFRQALELTPYEESYFRKLMHLHCIPYYRPRNGKAVFRESDIRAFLCRGRRDADYEIAARAEEHLAQRKKQGKP